VPVLDKQTVLAIPNGVTKAQLSLTGAGNKVRINVRDDNSEEVIKHLVLEGRSEIERGFPQTSNPNGATISQFIHGKHFLPFNFDEFSRGKTTRMTIQAMRRRVTPAATKGASPEQTIDLNDERLIGRELA
jgi:hypothetical protein